MSLPAPRVDDGFDDADEWWRGIELPPLHIDLTEDAPDVDDDPGAYVDRQWSESELPPLVDWDDDDQPPHHVLDDVPPAGPQHTRLPAARSAPDQLPESRLVVGGLALTRPVAQSADGGATGAATTTTPLEQSWVAGWSSPELVDVLRELQGHASWVQGLTQQALARVADLDPSPDLWCREEVAAALRLSPRTVGSRIGDAQALCHTLPRTVDALLAGHVGIGHALAVLETAALLPPDVSEALEDAVLGAAARQTPGQLRVALRRAAITLDPQHAEQARRSAEDDRRVVVRAGECGMSALIADLPAADAAAIYALLDAAADQQLITDRATAHPTAAAAAGLDGAAADTASGAEVAGAGGVGVRTKDQVRADLLVDVILSGLDPARLPTRHGRRPVINVQVSLDTLTGASRAPGWLDGYGPVTADTARQLAADPTGTWRRLITDPATQRLLAYDITTYTPPRAIAEHIIAANVTCVFPGCAQPAHRCDLDHVTPHSAHGPTTPENIRPLCRRHHRLKHHAGWKITALDDGSTQWVSPHQRRHHTRPPTRLQPQPPDPPGEPNEQARSGYELEPNRPDDQGDIREAEARDGPSERSGEPEQRRGSSDRREPQNQHTDPGDPPTSNDSDA